MSLEKQMSAGTRKGERPLLTLVIPTRNEEGNVPRLVRELGESLSGVDYRVVFVDDSTDETPKVIRALSEEDERIVLIQRAEAERSGGLSTAVAAGIDAVANESEYICVMDADLQHPPVKVREMLEEARESKADVVVASRYTRGGSYT
ncbi:MAG: glycosyltransferase, partial [Actinobacteria bacterium]|nr:glycosyltransferase [Actinomycetota bacterium]MCA1737527.1 glycosyltransferase [Actinomycetota bacterium]